MQAVDLLQQLALADAALAWQAVPGTAPAGTPPLPPALPRCRLPLLALPWPVQGTGWADQAATALARLLIDLAPTDKAPA